MSRRSHAGPTRRVRKPAVALLSRVVPGMAVVGSALILASSVAAQQPEPLQKSEVIRLLSGGTYSQGEVASIVERSCLSFRPTPRDLADFRALGAGDRVMAAIRTCASGPLRQPAREERPAPRPQPPPAQPRAGAEAVPEATLFVSPRQTAVPLGQEVAVTAELTLGASPVGNVRLELRRGTPGEGGDVVAAAVTGPDGRATLQIPAAEDAGFRWFSVVSVDRPMRGENVVEVRTRPSETAPRAPDGAVTAEEDGSSSGERSASGDEEGAGHAGGTASSDVSPAAESPPLLPEGLSIEDRERAAAEARRLSLEGRYGHAEAIFRRLVEASGRDVDVLLEYGRHLSRAGRHDQADHVLSRAEAVAPSDLEVLKARAFVKLWLDEPAEAARRYRMVTERSPEDAAAWRGLARALAADGRQQEAREAARRAAELAAPD